MLIREGRPEDIVQIVDIYGDGDHAPWDPFAELHLARWLSPALFKMGRFLVAEDEETRRLIGFSYVRFAAHSPRYDEGIGPYAFVEELHVRPQYQGKGIGSRLFDETVRVAESNGLKVIYTAVNDNNPVAAHIYMKRGFKVHHHVLYLKREEGGSPDG